MDTYNEKITLGQLFRILLKTNRFQSTKCTIWDNSRAIYSDKIGYIKGHIVSGRLAEISNCQYLFNRKIEDFQIKGFFRKQIEIVVSCDSCEKEQM